MRTNIEIDDALLAQAMSAAGLSTKRATVEEGLRLLVLVREQAKAVAELKGLGWVGDLILLEVLQGARDSAHAVRIERALRQYTLVPLLNPDLAPRAVRNYRKLRDLGITIRKTADIIIGTFCIEHRHVLLHDDRDFSPMAEHLGLIVA